jgi:hypothetical protein
MASNEYYFITPWRVAGTVEGVYDILGNETDLARWWPSVYLDVQVLSPGEKIGNRPASCSECDRREATTGADVFPQPAIQKKIAAVACEWQ